MERQVLEALMKDRLRPFDLFYVPSYDVFVTCCEWSAFRNRDVIAILNTCSIKAIEAMKSFVQRQRLGIHVLLLDLNTPLIHFPKHNLFIPHTRIRQAHDRSSVQSSDSRYQIVGVEVKDLGTIDKLPKILITDAASNWYGFRADDLIEVTIEGRSEVRLVVYSL